MRIALYGPRLTVAEYNRYHLSPADACDLAYVGLGNERTAKEARKFLSNVAERGYLPSERTGTGKTSPRKFSLKSCVILKVLSDLTRGPGARTYDFAVPIGNAVADLGAQLITTLDDVHELDTMEGFEFFIRYRMTFEEAPRVVHREEFSPATVADAPDTGIYAAAEVIWYIFRQYADYWSRDRIARGLEGPPGRYDGTDEKGDPLDISHHWYRGLTPLQRAKRMLEIEEFLAKRDGKATEGE